MQAQRHSAQAGQEHRPACARGSLEHLPEAAIEQRQLPREDLPDADDEIGVGLLADRQVRNAGARRGRRVVGIDIALAKSIGSIPRQGKAAHVAPHESMAARRDRVAGLRAEPRGIGCIIAGRRVGHSGSRHLDAFHARRDFRQRPFVGDDGRRPTGRGGFPPKAAIGGKRGERVARIERRGQQAVEHEPAAAERVEIRHRHPGGAKRGQHPGGQPVDRENEQAAGGWRRGGADRGIHDDSIVQIPRRLPSGLPFAARSSMLP